MSLAFVPPEKVRSYYDELCASKFFEDHSQEMDKFLMYFEKAWIGRNLGGRRKKALYDIALWNCYHGELESAPLTTNAIEAWHRGFNSQVQASHPTIWKLIDALKKDNAVNILKTHQINAGLDTKKNTYNDKHANILRVVQRCDSLEPLVYLKSIATNLKV